MLREKLPFGKARLRLREVIQGDQEASHPPQHEHSDDLEMVTPSLPIEIARFHPACHPASATQGRVQGQKEFQIEGAARTNKNQQRPA